jgi:hypothetical protein
MKARRLVKSYNKLQSYEFVSPPVLNQKVAAISDPKFINTRRLDNLHRAWDMPHRAHGPHQPSMRYNKGWRMIPTPDWDAPGIEKPKFVQNEETAGLLDRFVAKFDSLSKEDQAILLRKPRMNEAKDLSCSGEFLQYNL